MGLLAEAAGGGAAGGAGCSVLALHVLVIMFYVVLKGNGGPDAGVDGKAHCSPAVLTPAPA